jgi:hypothetical protein
MRNLMSTLLITLVGVSAQAQNKPLACQAEAAAGLQWENGRWATSTFKPRPPKFILVQAGTLLTTDSVAKALVSDPSHVTCRDTKPQIECADRTGASLFFDPRTLSGGISALFGGTMSGANKDSVFVQVFSCTPF